MPTPHNLLDLLGDRRVEEYLLEVRGQRFLLRFQPVVFFEHYDIDQLFALHGKRVFEVSFARLVAGSDGREVADYGTTGGGNAVYVLGAVAQAILQWAREKQPDFLYWWTLQSTRQTLYARMIHHFNAKGSGWQQMKTDPFTGLNCRSEVFWLTHKNDSWAEA